MIIIINPYFLAKNEPLMSVTNSDQDAVQNIFFLTGEKITTCQKYGTAECSGKCKNLQKAAENLEMLGPIVIGNGSVSIPDLIMQ